MGDVVGFGGITKLPIKPDDILERQKGRHDRVIVIGISADDKLSIAASDASLVYLMFDLDRAKWWATREVMKDE